MAEARKVKVDGKEAGYAKVIPPDSSRPGDGIDDPLIRLIATVMDTAFKLPGTRFRFGLDPLIGFFPGVGDGASALVSVFLIGMSARHGVPKIVLARMALNVLFNAVFGAVPVAGDLFSFWFKSNALNYRLFQKHAGPRRASTAGDWLFIGGLIGGILGVLALAMAGGILMALTLWNFLFR